jgi:hypothetical protein
MRDRSEQDDLHLTVALVSMYQRDLRKDRAMGDKSPKNTSKTKKQKDQKKAAAKAPPKK